MGRSTNIKAFISPDDPTYQKHSNVLKACYDAQAYLPIQTAEYFGSDIDEFALHLLEEKLEIKIPKHEWSNDYSEGYEILVKDIPKGTYKIRFYNSW